MTRPPMRALYDRALNEFEQALVKQGVYPSGHQNLRRALNGARDFVEFLLEGPAVLSKGRRRSK
jgi:hypothetical protein